MWIYGKKIQPAIEQCVAFIVLWTHDAKEDPARIKRELEYAYLPDSFPKNVEFVRTQMTEADLVGLVQSIERCYRIGVYG